MIRCAAPWMGTCWSSPMSAGRFCMLRLMFFAPVYYWVWVDHLILAWSYWDTANLTAMSLLPGERSGSVLTECLSRNWGVSGSSLTGVTALCLWARHIHPKYLVLVQPRKTHPDITENCWLGRNELNQTNNFNWWRTEFVLFVTQ